MEGGRGSDAVHANRSTAEFQLHSPSRNITEHGFPHADISAPQFQAVRLASARHETRLPGGARAGFFLGDGEGQGLVRASKLCCMGSGT